MSRLVLSMTGATGMLTADILVKKSPWPVSLIASKWGRDVYEQECGPFQELASRVHEVFDHDDLSAPVSSGSVETVGMVVVPCSCNTLGQIASGIGDNLTSRAAHCHLKERRTLVLSVRETPWSLIDLNNARAVASAGGIIMPISPPFYMMAGRNPEEVSLAECVEHYVDRVLALFGKTADRTWEDVR